MNFLNRCAFTPIAYSNTDDFEVNGSAPVTGFYAPADCLDPIVADAAIYHYFAESSDKSQHEEGDASWDNTNSKLLRQSGIIRNSSNSAALVNFSAAPTVYMGGPVAGDMGWVLVSTGDVSSPVDYIDISLPSDFSAFRLELLQFAMSPADYVAFITSADGGATFNIDTGGFAAYEMNETINSSSNFTDAVAYTGQNIHATRLNAELLITPGAPSTNLMAQGLVSTISGADGKLYIEISSIRLILATGRQNLLRLMPYGLPDNPPSSGNQIVGGSYRLLGLL